VQRRDPERRGGDRLTQAARRATLWAARPSRQEAAGAPTGAPAFPGRWHGRIAHWPREQEPRTPSEPQPNQPKRGSPVKQLAALAALAVLTVGSAYPAFQASNDGSAAKKEVEGLKQSQTEVQKALWLHRPPEGETGTSAASRAAECGGGDRRNPGERWRRSPSWSRLPVPVLCPSFQPDVAPAHDELRQARRQVRAPGLSSGVDPSPGPQAVGGRCAGEQGKYWEMHDRLFGNRPWGYRPGNMPRRWLASPAFSSVERQVRHANSQGSRRRDDGRGQGRPLFFLG
jgi:hypothetical protein